MNDIQSTEPNSTPRYQEDEIDLVELARTLWRRRALVLTVTAATTLSALAITLATPKTYTADATLLPISSGDSTGAFAAGLAAQLGPMAGMLGGLGGSQSADLVEILGSRSMANRVIERCNLEREVKDWKHRSELVTSVMKMTTIVAPNLKSKILIVKVKAKQPALAAAMANAYVSELKEMLDEIGYNSASRNRRFIERQLRKNKEELAKAEETLTKFQTENRLASLPETVQGSIRAISDLEAQRIGAEVQIKTTDVALGLVKSKVDSLQADPNAMIDLELKRKGLAAQRVALAKAQEAFLGKLASLPPKGMALARLQRDVQVQNAIYLALNQQYETAMIAESKDSDAFLQLDAAEVPEKPSAPRKLMNLMLGLMAGLMIGTVVAFTAEYLSKRPQVAKS